MTEPHEYPAGTTIHMAADHPIPEGWMEVPPDHWIRSAVVQLAPGVPFRFGDDPEGFRLVYRGTALPPEPEVRPGDYSIGEPS